MARYDKNSLKKAQVFIEMDSHIFLIRNLKRTFNVLIFNVMKYVDLYNI